MSEDEDGVVGMMSVGVLHVTSNPIVPPNVKPVQLPGAPPLEGRFEVVIVGGGILGLACARALAHRHPGMKIALLEKESDVAAHQTGRNSGVIHAGVYYAPGSLKARLCVAGARAMYEFCESHGVPFRRAGKLIVASSTEEMRRLRALQERARRNGVSRLRWLSADEIGEVEPHATGVAALHSPDTGIVDYAAVARTLADDLRRNGHTIATDHEIVGVTSRRSGLELRHRTGTVEARHALFCAGAWSDRLAVAAGAPPNPRIVPFRGSYRLIRPERRDLVRGMIYPVPDPALPFLGVHLTRHIDGRLSIGPTALLAAALDDGWIAGIRPRDLARTLTWPGTARMAWRMRSTARGELRHALTSKAFLESAAQYVPALERHDLMPGFSGVRAQALTRRGELVDDFVFSYTDRAMHVRNAPSPGATSSLAIAAYVADSFERRYSLS